MSRQNSSKWGRKRSGEKVTSERYWLFLIKILKELLLKVLKITENTARVIYNYVELCQGLFVILKRRFSNNMTPPTLRASVSKE